ncbi:MAG: cytochrome c biogenesis protein CcsA [Flavobacteriaceae bacterium]|nr:cytochrome c biogenesis protein CcsA [Flavobacteriaceae bacterium]
MKKLENILFSTRLTAILFIVFAIAMGVATFIESKYGTQTSKALVYNAKWFELIMLFFVINFTGNIFRYRLYRKEKWSVLIFHLAFVLILVGAGITRYISEEGIMVIKEGKTSNTYLSDQTYLNVIIDDGKDQLTVVDKPMLLSKISKNSFSKNVKFKDKELKIYLKKYIPFIADNNQYEFLHFVESTDGSRHDHYIKKGESQLIHDVKIGFDNNTEINAINFHTVGGKLKIKTAHEGTFLRMRDNFKGVVVKDSLQDFNLLSLHKIAGLSFVVPSNSVKGTYQDLDQAQNDLDALVLNIKANGKTKQITVKGKQYLTLRPKQFSFEGLNYRIHYGAKERTLVYGSKTKNEKQKTFHIKLRDFQLENYPGSQSPMSFASEVTVISPEKTFDYRIFMNNILNYEGYKFFQSSYEITEQYEETRLSVNRDYWGTLITYIGYFLLFGGLLISLFIKGTRFTNLGKQLEKIKNKRKAVTIVLFLIISTVSFGQNKTPQDSNKQETTQNQQKLTEKKTHVVLTKEQIDSIVKTNAVPREHSDKFAKIIIQDTGGRLKPIQTFASELLRKVHKKETFNGLDANQVFISIVQNNRFWFEVPIIFIERGNYEVREIIGISKKDKYAKFSDFITNTGAYKLKDLQEKAFKKQKKSQFEKDIINIDKRVNLLYRALEGNLFTIFPIQNDPTNKWISQFEIAKGHYKGIDSVFVKQIIPVYKEMLYKANISKDYTKADEILEGMIKFQKKFGATVYPKEERINLEIKYNKYDVFKKLFSWYLLIGVIYFIFLIVQIFYDNKTMQLISKIGVGIIIMLFGIHSIGLIVRWYISGHAPWSDAYETIIYIAWSIVLFGLVFGRKSKLTIATTAFLAAMFLFFAQQNYFDPAITNLVPVLNSYWLMIHVAIIVGSYGPFFMAFILGVLALFIMVFTNTKNKQKFDLIIKELTVINEMSITIGLLLLTIGNFLGGMWANESWGRYWGWDPKETWALISIMIYAFILHMRLIPGLKGRFLFNFASVISIATILMTYFGVNFYLSGLHSYGKSDAAITPNAVYYSIIFIAILSFFAFIKYKKYYRK